MSSSLNSRKTLCLWYNIHMLKKICTPNLVLDKLENLDLKHFYDLGYRALLIDLDNTLAPHYIKSITQREIDIINRFKDYGFKVMVVSNNTSKRVGKFLADSGIDYTCWSLKPLPWGYYRALRRMGVNFKQAIGIGDQMLTDVIGSNLMGMYSIYTIPLEKKDSFITTINRGIERWLFKNVVNK